MAEDSSNQYLHPRSASEHLLSAPWDSNHGVSINVTDEHEQRPPPVKTLSAPAYQSPIRHHKRTPSRSKGVKETLDAKSQYGSGDDNDGASVHRINQYIIKQEIGRGSFGAVHLAQDHNGHEYAVKEFSKSRLRKRAQSNLLRKPNQGRRPGQLAGGFNSPMHRISPANSADDNNSLSLIKEEIAIMKKLDHNNLVSLIEVLDDPQEDSLYMVLEMCKKGVAMKVGLEERAEPYDDETCRCWFRDMILGIEYLHAQGIIHRDIKPDNCLITDDNVLKIVDFGVSEMFEKQSEMATAKSAGSPAFMPPELCVAKHGHVSGKAADIWSMGVTLYCLRYGRIPFEKENIIDLYDAIRQDKLPVENEKDENFADLIPRILEKDPEKRITMEDMRNHPWVTKDGTDPLLPSEENCADLVQPPTEAEMDRAITGNMEHLMAVVKAARRFKTKVSAKRGEFIDGILGRESRFSRPPHSIHNQSKSQTTDDRRPWDRILVTSGIHRDVAVNDKMEAIPPDMEKLTMYTSPEGEDDIDLERRLGETEAHWKQRLEAMRHHPDGLTRSPTATSDEISIPQRRSRTFPVDGRLAGHAHDPLEDIFYLRIGHDPAMLSTQDDNSDYFPMISESPPAVEMNIYEQAYQEEMERILGRRGREPSIYMTRRIEHRDDIRALGSIKDAGKYAAQQAYARFERVSNYAYASGRPVYESSKSYAKYAGDKAGEGFAYGSTAVSPYLQSGKDYLEPWKQSGKEYLEPWKQSGKEYLEPWKESAKSRAGRAQEKFGAWYSKEGGSGEKFAGLVAKAQQKTRGRSPGPAVDTDAAAPESQAAAAEPQAAEEEPQAETAGTLSVPVQPTRSHSIPRKPVPEIVQSPTAVDAEDTKSTADSKLSSLPIGTSVFKEHI